MESSGSRRTPLPAERPHHRRGSTARRARACRRLADARRASICPCMDVMGAEILDLMAAGMTHVEELKRQTSCGMGPCQGLPCWEMMRALMLKASDGQPRRRPALASRTAPRLDGCPGRRPRRPRGATTMSKASARSAHRHHRRRYSWPRHGLPPGPPGFHERARARCRLLPGRRLGAERHARARRLRLVRMDAAVRALQSPLDRAVEAPRRERHVHAAQLSDRRANRRKPKSSSSPPCRCTASSGFSRRSSMRRS